MKTYTLPMGRLHAIEHKTPERVAYRRLPRYQERAADYSHGFTFAHADGCAHDD